MRNDFEESLSYLNFASKLWGLFKALIAGALNEMAGLTNVEKSDVLKKLNKELLIFYASHTNG